MCECWQGLLALLQRAAHAGAAGAGVPPAASARAEAPAQGPARAAAALYACRHHAGPGHPGRKLADRPQHGRRHPGQGKDPGARPPVAAGLPACGAPALMACVCGAVQHCLCHLGGRPLLKDRRPGRRVRLAAARPGGQGPPRDGRLPAVQAAARAAQAHGGARALECLRPGSVRACAAGLPSPGDTCCSAAWACSCSSKAGLYPAGPRHPWSSSAEVPARLRRRSWKSWAPSCPTPTCTRTAWTGSLWTTAPSRGLAGCTGTSTASTATTRCGQGPLLAASCCGRGQSDSLPA